MKLNHFHVFVIDLSGAITWLKQIWGKEPTYKDSQMASYAFDSFTMIVDISDQDIPCTIGFASENCDEDYQKVIKRGAIALEKPNDKEWGVRAAYIQGPGKLKFEIEQILK